MDRLGPCSAVQHEGPWGHLPADQGPLGCRYLTCLKPEGWGCSAVRKGLGSCVSWPCLPQVSSASWGGGQDSEWHSMKTHPPGQSLQPEGWDSGAGPAVPSARPCRWRRRWEWSPHGSPSVEEIHLLRGSELLCCRSFPSLRAL